MITPSFDLFCQKAKEGNLIPVYEDLSADIESPVGAFLKLRQDQYAYLLESVTGGETWGRYSFLGVGAAMIVRGRGRDVSVLRDGTFKKITCDGNPLDVLKEVLSEFHPTTADGLPRFFGGAVGFIGYDMVRFFEPVTLQENLQRKGTADDFFFLFTDTLLIFDHLTHRMKVVSYGFIQDADLQTPYQNALAKIEKVLSILASPQPGRAVLRLSTEERKGAGATLTSNFSKEQFKNAVLKIKEYIQAGDVFQVQLSQEFSTELKGDPFRVYRALRVINPSPYMFYLQFDAVCLVGSSPEVLVRLEEGRVETRPIAGTRRRGKTQEEDRAMEQELLSDPKERAEHLMLIDLGRNDIGRVSEYGSVKTNEVMAIERYSHVMHIVSNVVGQLAPGKDRFDLLRACFPAGTVTGAPKIRAMEIINQLEPDSRGLYAGAVGYFGFQGNMDLCITIRTIVVEGNRATIRAAAGIVADSDPELEYQETLNKAQAMFQAIEMACEAS